MDQEFNNLSNIQAWSYGISIEYVHLLNLNIFIESVWHVNDIFIVMRDRNSNVQIKADRLGSMHGRIHIHKLFQLI